MRNFLGGILVATAALTSAGNVQTETALPVYKSTIQTQVQRQEKEKTERQLMQIQVNNSRESAWSNALSEARNYFNDSIKDGRYSPWEQWKVRRLYAKADSIKPLEGEDRTCYKLMDKSSGEIQFELKKQGIDALVECTFSEGTAFLGGIGLSVLCGFGLFLLYKKMAEDSTNE